MATSRTPNMRPAHGAQRLRGRLHGRLLPRVRAGGGNPRSHVTPVGLGLFVLVVSTTCAIASVSLWWVPVYLGLLVGIFVTPPRRRSTSSASITDAGSGTLGFADLGSGLRIDCGDGTDHVRSFIQFDSGQTNVEPAEPMDFNPILTTTGSAKRRGRVRARKAPKPDSESFTQSLPVAWIQVGPGKFVRVEDGIQAVDSAPTEEEKVVCGVYPASEIPAGATPAVAPQTEPPEAQGSSTPPASCSGDAESIPVSNDRTTVSVTEEHGIAPTAFSLTPAYDSLDESPGLDLREHIDGPEVETAQLAEPDTELPPTQTAPAGLRGQFGASRDWVSRIQRRIVLKTPLASRVSSRRVIRTSPIRRLLVGASRDPSGTQRDPTCRAFGRMLRLHGMLRTRSPPHW